MYRRLALTIALSVATTVGVAAQNRPYEEPGPTTRIEPLSQSDLSEVQIVSRTIPAINYENRKSTEIDFRSTDLMPESGGVVHVSSTKGRVAIDARLWHLRPAREFGPGYLTYVLWAITPQGRPVNLGEIIPNDDHKARLKATTELQAFGLLVTAEPFFAVTRPSNMVVLQNFPRADTKGTIIPIDAKFEALQRGDYTVRISPADLPANVASKKVPLELLEARNAVAIARASEADQYAAEAYARAQADLMRAEDDYRAHRNKNTVRTAARAATQAAEDARLLSIQRREQERVAARQHEQERRTEQARAEASQAQQEAEEAKLQTEQAELQRQQAEAQTSQAEQNARQAREEAAQERAAADQAKQDALQQQQALALQAQEAQQQAQTAEQRAQQADQAREDMRQRLLAELNQVMQTRDSARGLIVEMNDVLFDTGKATLRADAKIRLARVAGIIEAYPDLRLNIEGYTDNTGSPEYNRTLSEERAATVRDFLIAQGVSANNVLAQGFGMENPIASNGTPQGRQMNRRVDLVVSGPEIGSAGDNGSGGLVGSK